MPAELSNNQRESVIQALGNPVSYVWGAPGTGKTQMVLSNAILQYIKIEESVLLVAPTNNALEQSLRGLINILDKNNISNKCIVRFGHATSEFVTQYPAICGAGHYDNLISNYKKDIENLWEKAEFQATYDRYDFVQRVSKNS